MTTRHRHSGRLHAWCLLALILGAAALVAVACGPAATTETVSESSVYPNVAWHVPPSLEEQIYRSTVIARALLQSVTATTAAAPDDGYHAVQELRFTVHEYLKGSGPTTLLVAVRDGPYSTEAAARAAAARAVTERTTTWDDRQAVLFLSPRWSTGGGAAGAAASTLTFTVSNLNQSAWDYSVDSLSRAWLPARDAGGAAGTAGTAHPVFITDGTESPPPVISLTDLRAKIAALAAELQAGEGIEGYAECLRSKIGHERERRASPWTPTQYEVPLASGTPAGTEAYRKQLTGNFRDYFRYWLSGPDKDLFQAVIADNDDRASTGFARILATARPLPAGTYQVRHNSQHYKHVPCNFVPDDAYVAFTATVTAPAGTVHEALFDPVALGAGVGADGANGVLSPAAFSVGETAATLQRLVGEARQLQLELSAAVPLADHYLDVIALDGTVALRLRLDDATTATTTTGGQAWRWRACAAPWPAGDQLMLRLHHSATTLPDVTTAPGCGPSPTFGASSYAFAVAENAAVDALVGTVTATGAGNAPVTYAIMAGNEAGAFAIGSGTGQLTVAGALDAAMVATYLLTVEASAGGASATVPVTITVTAGALTPPPAPANLSATPGPTRLALAWEAVPGASRYEVEFIATGDESWTSDADALTAPAHTVADLTCGTAYEVRVRAYGDGVTHAAAWGAATADLAAVTTVCPPAFGAESYSFTVSGSAGEGTEVGTATATPAGSGAVTYAITTGNGAGAFAIGSGTGQLTVAGALDAASYALTVSATEANGGTATVPVTISVTPVPAVTVAFGQATYTTSEGAAGGVTVTVTLSADPERAATIPLTVTPQGGAEAADYTGVPASVTIASGTTSTTFHVVAVDDALDDDGESLVLGFGTLPARVAAGAVATTTISLQDDDDPPPSPTETTVWSATLTVGLVDGYRPGYQGAGSGQAGALDDTDFDWQGVSYAVWSLTYGSGRLNLVLYARGGSLAGLTLHLGDVAVAVADAEVFGGLQLIWDDVELSWTAGATVTLRLTQAASDGSGG